MPRFLHLPSGQHIEATGPRAARYRRSHRFQELPDTPESSETPTIAPDSPVPTLDDLTTTTIANMTVNQVLQLVGTNPDRAARILKLEQAGRNRVTLTAKLRRIT